VLQFFTLISDGLGSVRLFFCQNGVLLGGSFWQKDSLVTLILFELMHIVIFSLVANFGDQPLIKLLEQKFYPDSNLRVKLMYESVK
jgi:hypothetical protein